jgi:hypothetical protein
VGVTAGSREVPGRKSVTGHNNYDDNNNNDNKTTPTVTNFDEGQRI